MPAIMDTIMMEMSKMWKVIDGHMDMGQTMVNRPQHKLAWSKVLGELTIEDLQDGCYGGHCGYHNKMVLAILNLHVPPMPPTKFWLNLTYHLDADEVWRFSRWPPWHHLIYRNNMILTILNFYVSPMPTIKFQLNQTYGLGGDVVWRFPRQPIWRPSWILEENDFSNSYSPCGPNTSHQVWAQSDFGFRSRCGFKIFKMATQAVILDSRTEWF